MIITAVVISTLSSLYILPMIIKFLERNRMVARNYNNSVVCNAGGMFFSFNILLISTGLYIVYIYHYKMHPAREILSVLIASLIASFTGYIDDNSNDKSKGIIGHGRMLLKGELSAGSIKACGGIIASILICFIMEYHRFDFLINFFLISLMQNLINLLDVRPGRAIKLYAVLSLLIIPFTGYSSVYTSINGGIIVSLFFYLTYDLNEVCMMGDTGSNVLGIVLGTISASSHNIYFRLTLLVFLLSVQVYGEKKSISVLMEKNSILNYLDMLGRVKNQHDKNKKGSS